MSKTTEKIIIPGGAGLVGQNLIIQLLAEGYRNIIVLDKHRHNLAILQALQPHIICEHADLSKAGAWQRHFIDAAVVVMLQAQIGGNDKIAFKNNNLEATKLILSTMSAESYLVHVSSSVVTSVAEDDYTRTKTLQEQFVLASGIPNIILRPTLMFGWFDRKHLGWLARFMQKMPVFPVPGNGCYLRQPLYVNDFCSIIMNCIQTRQKTGIYNISGQEYINYIDMMRQIKKSMVMRTPIIKLPYHLFYALLRLWELFDSNPPFTTQQLKALVADDKFEIIDWPNIFAVTPTAFNAAVNETFNHPIYSKITLEF